MGWYLWLVIEPQKQNRSGIKKKPVATNLTNQNEFSGHLANKN